MNESESYWMAVVADLDGMTEPLKTGQPIAEDLAPWAAKLMCELYSLFAPKNPLRVGMKPTANRVGRALGSQFAALAESKEFRRSSLATNPAVKMGVEAAHQSAMPHFDLYAATKKAELHSPVVESKLRHFLLRVIEERPLEEVADFYHGFSVGLRNISNRITPTFENGVPKLTPKQIQRIRTIAVYWVSFLHWQAIDKLDTSMEAFEFLAARMPEQMVGYDPERIRKMFYRLGKKFKRAGRPVGKRK